MHRCVPVPLARAGNFFQPPGHYRQVFVGVSSLCWRCLASLDGRVRRCEMDEMLASLLAAPIQFSGMARVKSDRAGQCVKASLAVQAAVSYGAPFSAASYWGRTVFPSAGTECGLAHGRCTARYTCPPDNSGLIVSSCL